MKYVINSRHLTYVYNELEFEILRPLDPVQPMRITQRIDFEELETDNFNEKISQQTEIIKLERIQ